MKRSFPLKLMLAVLAVVVLIVTAVRWRQGKAQQVAVPNAASAPAAPLKLQESDIVRTVQAPLSPVLPLSGTVKAKQVAVIKAKVPGELVQLLVREGEAVKKGQVLGQIDTLEADLRLQQARESAAQAAAQLDIAQRNHRNNQALVDQGFISPTAVQTSQANEQSARAGLQAAQAAVSLASKAKADATLIAPFSGVVSQRLAQAGERVAIEARILEVVDLGLMEVEALVSPQDAASIQVGQTATMQVDGLPAPVLGQVARINPAAQSGSRAIAVYLALPAGPGLRHGLFAQGRLRLSEVNALAVPVDAVRVDDTRPQVHVVEGGVVQTRAVVTGSRGERPGEPGLWVTVSSGLKAGEVVLRGSTGALRPGTLAQLPTPAANNPSGASASAAAAATPSLSLATSAPR